ncbi:SLC13 family permease [Arenibaculum sp.]|jgi:di/tricarboxylate transporter|uniref:SLC13 family permease n=1 Tax=Arenibaculum sp. TaxID=2865862 RepID=UPI002E1075B4|nr:SLC13 family permease [Arenibaculum sp.]
MDAAVIDQVVVLCLLVLVFVAFARDWMPPDLVALSAAALLLATGILATEDVLGVFGNAGVVTVAAMFVLSGALERTGVVEILGDAATGTVGGNRVLAFLFLVGIAVASSAFVNNTPVVVMLTPVAIRLCHHLKLAPSRMLIPLSYGAILGGTCTLIGTSTNLVTDGVAQRMGLASFGIFEITGLGLVMAAVGIAYLALVGYHLLPDRHTVAGILSNQVQRQYLTEVILPPGSQLAGLSLAEAGLKTLPGARVIDVIRNDDSFRRKLDDVQLAAGDRLLVKTGVAGLMGLRQREGLSFEGQLQEVATRQTVVVEGIVGPRSSFVDHRLAEFNLRRRYGLYIIAVHRQGVNLRDKFEEVRMEVGDVVLMEGSPDGVHRLVEAGDLINLTEPEHVPVRKSKAPVAVAAVLAVVLLAAFDVMPIAGLALIGAVVVVVAGCLDRDEAYRAIDWRILFMILGMLTLGIAMEKTGLVETAAGAVALVAGTLGPLGLLAVVYFIASALTEVVTNNAVAVVLTPVAISLAQQLGLDPRPFVVAVMFGASASFATPVGYQTNTFVYGAGGYRYLDFVKVGLPLNLLLWLVATLVIPLFWPLVPVTP